MLTPTVVLGVLTRPVRLPGARSRLRGRLRLMTFHGNAMIRKNYGRLVKSARSCLLR